jgi:hypothetical protein
MKLAKPAGEFNLAFAAAAPATAQTLPAKRIIHRRCGSYSAPRT